MMENHTTKRGPWFVANDPVLISVTAVNLDEVISTHDTITVVTSTNIVLLFEEIQFVDKANYWK